MRKLIALMRSTRGAAAAEMAIVTPLLVLILAVLTEIGFYFYSEHRLVESVRDAARYAARQSFTEYGDCPAHSFASGDAVWDNSLLVARKGSLDSSDPDRLWGWAQTGGDAPTFSVSYTCTTSVTSAGGNVTNLSGIYADVDDGAPVVTVDAQLAHQSVFAAFGFRVPVELNASQQAAVAGL